MADTNLIIPPNIGDVYITPYKSYVALLSQTGTNAPVATVMNSEDSNYLGDLVWSRLDTGVYYGTLEGIFTENKTLVFLSITADPTVYQISAQYAFFSTDNVAVVSFQLSNGANVDGVLSSTPIEVIVYP